MIATAPHLQIIFDRLQGLKQTAKGYSALCPAHDDRNPSLSLSSTNDGTILLKCHAGCTVDDVCASLDITSADLFPKNNAKPKAKVITTYDYRDENGKLLYQVCRFEPKGFRQRRPDGKDNWIWNLKGIRRVLYRLDELQKSDHSRWIYLVEGEKDVDRLVELGFVATTSSMGAGKWLKEYSESLTNRQVVIIPDNDRPGEEHAAQVASSLYGKSSDLKVIRLPNLAEHGDVSDWLNNGGTTDILKKLVKDSESYHPDNKSKDCNAGYELTDGRKSQATKLIEIGQQGELFHNASGEAYATVPVNNHNETWPIKSKGYKGWLTGRFWAAERKSPSAQAMQDALGTLNSIAVYEGTEKTTSIRIAEHGNAIWLDLADQEWKAVKITSEGWETIVNPPVKFLRSKAMLSLPKPIQSGSVSLLRQFLNLGSNEDWVLVISWLIASLRPVGPYPVLLVNGEQGSCKSTLSRMLRAIVDPNMAPIRAEPKNARDLMIAASNSWFLAFDNLSYIQPWLSDAFCRLATGGGFATRELYSNGEEMIFDATRPVIINGISELASRSDLLDRAVCVTLPTIRGGQRKTETELWAEFYQKLPLILGAFLDAVSSAMRRLPSVTLKNPPRMADFATWAIAASEGLGLTDDAFISAYATNKEDANSFAIEASPVGPAITSLMNKTLVWQGTAQELLTELEENHCTEQIRKRREWPKNPRAIGKAIRRVAPNLRQVGIEVILGRSSDKERKRIITLECIDDL